MSNDLATKAAALRALHVPGRPILLPNAWDAASARAVEAAGFAAVATGSAAVAESLGYEDANVAPPDEMFGAVRRIAAAVAVPVTADLEAGYGLPADELVARLLAAGAVGCNLEDTDHAAGGDRLVVPAVQAARIEAVRRAADTAGVPVVINARVDAFLRGVGDADAQLADAVDRGRRYLDAGADCVYPIWAADEDVISALVGALRRINVYARPEAPPVARLAELGVARISWGPWIHRLSMRESTRAIEAIRDGRSPYRD